MATEPKIIDESKLQPWFGQDERRALQRAAVDIVNESTSQFQDELDGINAIINDLTVSPIDYSLTAAGGQTVFNINGVATDQGELVLVFRNGSRLRPTFDYTTTFTLDPEVTTITLLSPASGGDIIAGVIYNIAVDSIGAVDAQARSDISTLAATVAALDGLTPEAVEDIVGAMVVAGTNTTVTYDDLLGTLTISSGVTVQEEGSTVVSSPTVNFVGAGVTATNVGGVATVTITGGGALAIDDLTDVTITAPALDDVIKWNGSGWVNLPDAGGGGGGANLTFSRTATSVTVLSDSGTDAVLPVATGSLAGIFSSSEFTKLSGIATGATANSSDATLLNRANHTGTQAVSTLSQSGASTGQVLKWNGSAWAPGTDNEGGGGGGGTVTSVGFSASDSSLSVSGSPITSSGSITVSLNTVAVNKGGTGATTASAARTNLGLGTAATSNSGDFASASHTHDASAIVSGTLAVARGGTGVTSSTGTGSNVLSASPTFSGTASFGTITASGDITAFSDIRLKELLKPVHVKLEDIASLSTFDYTFSLTGHKSTGIAAQEIKELLPRLVPETEDEGYLSVDYAKAAMVLVVSLAREVRELKKELAKYANS